MNKKTLDHEWQQLQTHIEDFVGLILRNDVQRVEYKPRFIAPLLEMSCERHQNELQGKVVISDNFSQKRRGT